MLKEENTKLKTQLENYNNSRKSYYEKNDESDIITGCHNVPTIWYNDETGKKHRYYVDIFIPSQNRCIEVKSPWTEQINKDNIFLKQQAGKELGYNYEIWVYDGKGVRFTPFLISNAHFYIMKTI